jgi:hypothetical protein
VNAVDPTGHNKTSEKVAAWFGAIGAIIAWPGGNPEAGLPIAGIGGMIFIGGEIYDWWKETPPRLPDLPKQTGWITTVGTAEPPTDRERRFAM